MEGRDKLGRFVKGYISPYRKKFTKKELERIVKLYLKGKKSVNEISKIFNLSYSPIKRILLEMGIKIRKEVWNKGLTKEDPRVAKYFNHPNHITWKNIKKIDKFEKKRIQNLPTREQKPNFHRLNEEKIINLYKKGLSTREIGKIFGVDKIVILDRLKHSGISRRKAMYPNKNILKTDDGHLVKSSPELFIDNWLFHNKIRHVYDKEIGYGRYKCDFYLPNFNLYIEYFGIENLKSYKEKTKRKLEVYKKLGLNLLTIFPNDNIQEKINVILKAKQEGIKVIRII